MRYINILKDSKLICALDDYLQSCETIVQKRDLNDKYLGSGSTNIGTWLEYY